MNYQGFKIKCNRNILVNLESVIVYVVVICEQTLCGKPSTFTDQQSCHYVNSSIISNKIYNIPRKL